MDPPPSPIAGGLSRSGRERKPSAPAAAFVASKRERQERQPSVTPQNKVKQCSTTSEELAEIAKPARPSDAVEAPGEPAPHSHDEIAQSAAVANEVAGAAEKEEEPICIDGVELRSGDLVWAKYDTYPWWPCHLCTDPETGLWRDDKARTCRVIFFGDDTEAYIPHRKLKPFLVNLGAYRHATDDGFQEGVTAALEHIGRTDLIEQEPEKPPPAGMRRPRRVTSAARQAEEAAKLLAARGRNGRLNKKKVVAEADEDEDDLGLSDMDSEPEEEESDGDDNVSEGEQEEEAPSSADEPTDASDFSDDDEAPRKRKRAAPKKPAAKKQKQQASEEGEEEAPTEQSSRLSSLDGALSGLACDTSSTSASGASPAATAAPPAAARTQKSRSNSSGSGSAGGVDGDKAVAESEWKALAAQGKWSQARTVRLRQWACTLTLQDCEKM